MANDNESRIQQEFISIIRQLSVAYPKLSLLFAIPNGHKRHPATTRKLKAEGVLAGIPDTFLPVPKIHNNTIIKAGLFIEFKSPAGKLSPTQSIIKEALIKNHYEYAVCRTSSEALDIVLDYLDIKGV